MSENTEKKTSKNSNYLSAKESRRISRENRRITTAMEKKYQRKKVPESEYLTQMRDPKNVVEFDDLHTYFFTDTGTVKAVDGVSFDVPQGVTVGVVGESGCGKSVTSLSLMQLLQRPQGQIVSGQIRLNLGEDGKAYDVAKMPMYADGEDPRQQAVDDLPGADDVTSTRCSASARRWMKSSPCTTATDGARKQVKKHDHLTMLEMVGIANSEGVYKMYPHELSGGMRQRVMIAMALACNPKLDHRRRAHHGAGRDHPGTDPGSAARTEGQDQRLDHAHHPRPWRHRRNGGLRCGHVCRPRGGKGHGAGDLCKPRAPLHHRPDGVQARHQQARGSASIPSPARCLTPSTCRITAISATAAKCAVAGMRGQVPARDPSDRHTRRQLLSLCGKRQGG